MNDLINFLLHQLRHISRQLIGCFCLGYFSVISIGSLAQAADTVMLPHLPYPGREILIAQTRETTAPQRQRAFEAAQYDEAARLWQQAAAQSETRGQRLQQVRHLNNAALAYQQLSQWDAAESLLETSFAILAEIDPEASNTPASWAQTWTTQGGLLLARSQFQTATEAFDTAEQYYRRSEDISGILRSRLNQAQALQMAGYYQPAIRRLETVAPPWSDHAPSPLTAVGLRKLGELKRVTGEFAQSRQVLEQSLQIAEQLGDVTAIAAAQLSLGHTVAADPLATPDDALTYFEAVIEAQVSAEFTVKAAIAQLRLFLRSDRQETAPTVVQILSQALPTLSSDSVRTYAYLDTAELLVTHSEEQYRDQAVQFLTTALEAARTRGDKRAESYALGLFGQVYQSSGQLADAQVVTQRALDLANQLQAAEISYRWEAQLGQLKRDTGELATAIDHYTSAVNTLQSFRTDLVAMSDEVRYGFSETIEPIYRDLVDLLTRDSNSSSANLEQARSVTEALQLAELENFFREVCLAVSTDIDQLVDNAASPTAVFYPIILPDRVEVIVKLPQQPLSHYAAAVPKNELESFLEELRQNLKLPYTERVVQTQAAQLYSWLLQPAEAELALSPLKNLVFVLDGALRNIPMGLLFDGERYLIERYGIAVAPGLQLVDPKPIANQQLTAIAAGLSESPDESYSDLAAVEAEVNHLAQALNGRVLLNQAFTQAALATTIQNTAFPIVHLATHGKFSSNPEETFILAWDGEIQLNTLNRLLRNSEQGRESAIELLVLSACETAIGDKRAALGLAGVAVRAGARSTIASLWRVDDEATALLMAQFYEALRVPGTSRAAALQKAQVALMNSRPLFRHPRYWGAYVLVGNWL